MAFKHKVSNYVIVIVLILSGISHNLNAQVFSGLGSFKNIIEYEGQRYLMEEVYKITSTDFDRLTISKTITETDYTEGFMFVLTSYIYNGKSGVVLTSFNSMNFQNSKLGFVNIHLSNEEYIDLYNSFNTLSENKLNIDDHLLRRFNDRLIIDANNDNGILYYTLWVDSNRHTFLTTKWNKAFNLYNKYIEKPKTKAIKPDNVY